MLNSRKANEMSNLDLRLKIIDYLKSNLHADGIDVATDLNIPIDVADREIEILIDDGVVRRQYIGMVTRLVLENKNRR
jgi:hypothetical protein